MRTALTILCLIGVFPSVEPTLFAAGENPAPILLWDKEVPRATGMANA